MEKAEGNQSNHTDLGILIGRSGAHCGEDSGILNANCRFYALGSFDPERVCDFF